MSNSTYFGLGAALTFLAAFTLTGSVIIVPVGGISLVFHGVEHRRETFTEGILWASRICFLFTAVVVAGGAVILGAMFSPRLVALWAGTLLTLGLIWAYMRRVNREGDDGPV